ncbi:TonB-dependent receptor [Coraliomargarita algicola]|uniref:TonB-dependent receptor n=1 Tax=Coraliomargarita algicola TaxID=3092156 RepID=A0ABZ0RHD2_9BACT|nr:TonB-dependent receptor [Coraliomargarita sp. J2-16]WPJ95595.1 TonB-dependent receptor [Coraliomargarita sp. J2-16]
MRRIFFSKILLSLFFGIQWASAALQASEAIELISVENLVEVQRSHSATWTAVEAGILLADGDRVRTGEFSRAALRYPSGNIIRLNEFSTIRLAAARTGDGQKETALELKKGALYFFSRRPESESDIQTAAVNAAIRGTEFELRVHADQSTELSLFDGAVDLSNAAGALSLVQGESALTQVGHAPVKVPMIDASRYMQWYLYYPGVLDTRELLLDASYSASVAAYRAGDLLAALASLPSQVEPTLTADTRVYRAAIILASGQVDQAADYLRDLEHSQAAALLELIRTVQGSRVDVMALSAAQSASDWLVRSYTLQANGDLEGARAAAARATELYPEFGYAWARLARLHFGFGDTTAMRAALSYAERYNSSNPEVYTLQGFRLAADGQASLAEAQFLHAVNLAPNYSDAWLGLALVRFNQGQELAALQDMLAAAALQPNQSLLRSYLAKGFAESHQVPLPLLRAQSDDFIEKSLQELELAKQLDPGDPTPWLYAALIKRDTLRFNEAVRDLQRSVSKNHNRGLFRSNSLIDEDLAVRRSNLADIYQQAGLPTQALAEAGKAVQADYTNFAAHDFLARVYREGFDTTRINQRNDTALNNEFFLRNALAPVGAGIASQRVSNQEYSSLFNQLGHQGTVEGSFDSRGRYALRTYQAYQGGNYEIALELQREEWDTVFYNDDFESRSALLHFKFEPTLKDRFYSVLILNDSEQGDLTVGPDPDALNSAVRPYTIVGDHVVFTPTSIGGYPVNGSYGRDPDFRIEQSQEPLLFNTYARKWNDQNLSLLLYGWTDTSNVASDPLLPLGVTNLSGIPITQKIYDISYLNEQAFELHSFEAQHIWKGDQSQVIAGARLQFGEFEDDITMRAAINSNIPASLLSTLVPYAVDTDGTGKSAEDFERIAVYSQFSHVFSNSLTVVAGLKYDSILYPDGLQSLPRTVQSQSESQLSPQLGFIWQVSPDWLLRGAYARSMSGYRIEDRIRLEPSNIAGLTTAYTSIAPSQVTSGWAGGTIDTLTLALNGELAHDTFLSLDLSYGQFEAQRTLGRFTETTLASFANSPGDLTIAEMDQRLDYDEMSFTARVDHLLSSRTSVGVSFSWQFAQIDEQLRNDFGLDQTSAYLDDTSATLYTGSLYARYQHTNGWFGGADLQYWVQQSHSIAPEIADTYAPNVNFSFGYRLQQQRGEITFSILNLTDEEYELNPVNNYNEPPHERTFVIQTRFSF